jgi:hypothetical protein|nr:MAG TPA: hypothetical protein [Caudoviricetes sp.]
MITENELVELRLKLKEYPMPSNLIGELLVLLSSLIQESNKPQDVLRAMFLSTLQYVSVDKELKIYKHMNNIRCFYRLNSYIMKMAGYTSDLKLEASDELLEEFISYLLIWLDKLGYCNIEYLTEGL